MKERSVGLTGGRTAQLAGEGARRFPGTSHEGEGMLLVV